MNEAEQKRKKLAQDHMKLLLHGDCKEDMDAFTFRKLLNATNPENQLVDLTFNLINTAIEKGHEQRKMKDLNSPKSL